jgi:DNA repair protein SbcC/Rad50
MGIESIRLRNFQSHKHTRLTFTPGINVITGSSDVGKSSIMRAIRWVITNRPTGTAFASHFCDKPTTSVMLTIDGKTVTRTRSKSINCYKLAKQEFKAVRTDVPDEITDFINLSDDINLQGQHDQYFLLQDSSGEVAKKLNKVANLDIIDFSLKSVNANLSNTNRDITNLNANIEDLTEQLVVYDNLDIVEKMCGALTDQFVNISECKRSIDDLENLIERIEYTEKEKKRLDIWLGVETGATKLMVDMASIDSLRNSYESIQDLLNQIEVIHDTQVHVDKLLNLDGDLKVLLMKVESYTDLTSKHSDLVILVSSIQRTNESLEKINDRINDITGKVVYMVEETGICPLCGEELKDAQHVLEWL